MSVLVSDILLSSLVIWNDVLEDGKMAAPWPVRREGLSAKGARREGCSTSWWAVNSLANDHGEGVKGRPGATDGLRTHPLTVNYIASTKFALWKCRNRFVVEA
jgi:hypothetical protein